MSRPIDDDADDEPRDKDGKWTSGGAGTRSSKEVLAEISSVSEKAEADYNTAYNAAYAKAHEIMKTEGAEAAEAHLTRANEQAKTERDSVLNPKIEALTAELYKSKAAEKEEEKNMLRQSAIKAAQKKADDLLKSHEWAKTSASAQTRKRAKGLLEEHKAALAEVSRLSAKDSAMPSSRLTLKDSFVLDGVHRSESGYLAAHAKVARTGVQVYQGCEVGKPDKERVTLYRPPEEVFHVDAMHSMAHRPVTLTHPPVMVDSKNWKKYAKGQTIDPIVRDGEYVSVPITLMDQATIDAYESGDACELSMGYTTDIDWTAGVTPQGEAYEGVQRNIRANHLAFVPQARGGEKLRFGDSATCHACGASMTMKDSEYVCDGCGGTKKDGDWVPVDDGDDEPRDDHGRWTEGYQAQANGKTLEQNPHSGVEGDFWASGWKQGVKESVTEYNPEKEHYSINPKNNQWKKFAIEQRRNGRSTKSGDSATYDREWSAEERREAEKKGHAMAGGKFPIESAADVRSAVKLSGKGGPAVKAFIIKRAKAIGAEGELPDDWKQSQTKDGKPVLNSTRKRLMALTNTFDGVTVEFADELSASNMNTAFSALKARLKDAEKKAKDDEDEMDEKDKKNKADCEDAAAKISAKDGEIAVLKKQLADAAVTPAMLDSLLRDREMVKDAAKKVLKDSFPFDGKSIAEIKLAAVTAKLGDAAVKDMNEAAVSGAFVALTAASGNDSGNRRLADALGSHARSTTVVGDSRSEGVRLRDEAHALMVDRMRNPKSYDADGRKIA